MDPQTNPVEEQVPPTQPSGVMVDLLHPQESLQTATPPPPPPPPPLAPVPVAAPPTLQSQFAAAPTEAPQAPVPVVDSMAAAPIVPKPIQIGSTQLPALSKPSSKKKPTIIALIIFAILALLGVTAFFLLQKKETPAPQTTKIAVKAGEVTNLSQSSTDGVLATGAISKQPTVNFSFDFPTTANTGSVVPEIEVLPIGAHFTDKPSLSGQPVAATGHTLHFSLASDSLKDGNYHWQARMRVGADNGAWKAFDMNPFSFGISSGAVAPQAVPIVDTVGGNKVADGKVTTTQTKPVFSGTAVVGSAITLTIKPENIVYKANTDNSGAWTITPTKDLASGDHPVTVAAKSPAGATSSADITVSINPVVAAATPAPSDAPVASPTPSATPAPTLAPTGDPVVPITALAVVILSGSLLALWRLSTRDER